MQTQTTSKRFDLGQLKVAALALGIAASVAVGAVMYSATRHDDSAVSVTGSAQLARSDAAKERQLDALADALERARSQAAPGELSEHPRARIATLWHGTQPPVTVDYDFIVQNAFPANAVADSLASWLAAPNHAGFMGASTAHAERSDSLTDKIAAPHQPGFIAPISGR